MSAEPTAKLTALSTRRDNVEIIRDKLAEILLVESKGQQALAREAGEDPELYRLRVFTECSSPWDEYLTPPTPDDQRKLDAAPIVNIRWDESKVDPSSSNTIERQKVTGTYFLDCYGYGVARATPEGHDSGDETSALEAQRCARLVRSWLMAGAYNYLEMRGTVWRRLCVGAKAFEPPIEQRSGQHVQGVRVSFAIDFNELSPQIEGVTLAGIDVTVRNASGEVTLFQASYATPAIP
jgi:hypothetical protein